ncbi:uncharacterized protein TNCV_2454181 [Trichonephila clavipes]|nr:uncharacterized protein TNCV_2454181 [Trichonephila clavipes]
MTSMNILTHRFDESRTTTCHLLNGHPDLTLYDLFQWGYVKDKLSDTGIGSEDQTQSKPCFSSCNDLEEDLKQQPLCQDSPKDVLSDSGLEIELAIPFVPNRDPPDTPQQSELGQCGHRARSLPKPGFHHLYNCVFQHCWIDGI